MKPLDQKIIAALLSNDSSLAVMVRQDFARVYAVAYRYYREKRLGPFAGEQRIFRVVDRKAG